MFLSINNWQNYYHGLFVLLILFPYQLESAIFMEFFTNILATAVSISIAEQSMKIFYADLMCTDWFINEGEIIFF